MTLAMVVKFAMPSCAPIVLAFAALYLAASAEAIAAPPKGSITGVQDLLDRILPGSRGHFTFSLASSCGSEQAPCYQIADTPDGRLAIVGTSASELTAGLGFYLRSYCNMTIGWPRGGGSHVFLPNIWPKIGLRPVVRRRNVPWSYLMNVCTHSYSLVWYDWQDWQRFIDWMALSGINNVLALTGQEEVQYKIFKSLGLSDDEIIGWFNGPALLTWSRGQNEYGAGIAGPLPRSWMKNQWLLQKQILARYRDLGIVGQLPGFQGNVPIALKAKLGDANITTAGATGWMDSLDPMYGKIADMWMKAFIQDFGTDHWYQLDGYFNGGTAPWLQEQSSSHLISPEQPTPVTQFSSATEIPVDPDWYARGVAAFTGLNRTDPDAIWSYQGFAFVFWKKDTKHLSWLKGFVDAVPPGRFNIVDMAYGDGEWRFWNNTAFFGAKFFWTALHNFGGTDGIKGNLSKVNEFPFAAMEADTGIWGTGFTDEGIDQNPAYYDFLLEQPWRTERVPDIAESLVARAHKRYGLQDEIPEVAASWRLLAKSMYAMDVGVQDDTGVAHLPGTAMWDWNSDRRTPAAPLCQTFQAWAKLVAAAPRIRATSEPFTYDLINLGRDVLARLSTPMSVNFSEAVFPPKSLAPSTTQVSATSALYQELLNDLDELVGTDQAFLLGSWLAMARRLAGNATDCNAKAAPIISGSCEQFYEWNARVQVTTWNPTPKGASKVPGGPIDYASKHWNGLIKDYYGERASRLMKIALAAAESKKVVEQAAVDRMKAELAYEWTTAFHVKYPEYPKGDAVVTSQKMLSKYAKYFDVCSSSSSSWEEVVVSEGLVI